MIGYIGLRTGDEVRTEFCRGRIQQFALGGERDWNYPGWYYLVLPVKRAGSGVLDSTYYKPHWVKHTELIELETGERPESKGHGCPAEIVNYFASGDLPAS